MKDPIVSVTWHAPQKLCIFVVFGSLLKHLCAWIYFFLCVISDVTVYKEKNAEHNSAALGVKSRNISPFFFKQSKSVHIY